MSNLTDALIAAKLVGGNGGSGGGSGLPEIRTETVEIVPQTTVAFSDAGSGMYTAPTDFVATSGSTYTVTWDEADYECTPLVMGGQYALGNMGILGGEDTGEPFLLTNAFGGNSWVTQSTAATHVCKIVGLAQTPADGSALVVVGGEWTVQDGYGYTKDSVVTPIESKYIPSTIRELHADVTTSNVLPKGQVKMVSFNNTTPPMPEGTEGAIIRFRLANDATPFLVQHGGLAQNGTSGNAWVYNVGDADVSVSSGDEIVIQLIL